MLSMSTLTKIGAVYLVVGLAGMFGVMLLEPGSPWYPVASLVLGLYVGHTAFAAPYWWENLLR